MLVYFSLNDNWELVQTVEEDYYTISTYKYVVSKTNNVNNCVFKAGEEHVYVDGNEITVLQGDVIYVSDKYSELYRESEDLSFLLKFEAYIHQSL